MTREADKLIGKAAREVLKPMGLFQKGTSRIWIDDRGWFLLVVEFQPSSWSQGAYLNVGVSFLWHQGKGFSEALPYNIGGRELEHIEYTGCNDEFFQQMTEMAQYAKRNVQKYRTAFGDTSSALQEMEHYHDANIPMSVVELWNRGMFYYLYGENTLGDKQMTELLVRVKNEREYQSGGKIYIRDWVVDLSQSAEKLLAQSTKEQFVISTIMEKRQRFRDKSSYKKLPVHPLFQ